MAANNPSLKEAVTGKADNPSNAVAVLSKFLDKFKPQMALALPKHLNPDRMCRLALTAFSTTPKLQECDSKSIAGAIMTASIMGLEIGVDGQGFLVPYGKTCQFVPGWKGMADLVNRSGRATVWTGAVFEGDFFEYELGANPRCVHRPGAEDDPNKLLYAYAIGRVNGAEIPVIEVWTIEKIKRHRDKYNKQGTKHYSYRDFEMYARKVPLLQVIKYMPKSIEVMNAVTVAEAAEMGKTAVYDGDFQTVTITEPGEENGGQQTTEKAGAEGGQVGGDQQPGEAGQPAGGEEKKADTTADKAAASTTRKPDRPAAMAQHVVSYAQVNNKLKAARDAGNLDDLHLAADLIKAVPDATVHAELDATYREFLAQMGGGEK